MKYIFSSLPTAFFLLFIFIGRNASLVTMTGLLKMVSCNKNGKQENQKRKKATKWKKFLQIVIDTNAWRTGHQVEYIFPPDKVLQVTLLAHTSTCKYIRLHLNTYICVFIYTQHLLVESQVKRQKCQCLWIRCHRQNWLQVGMDME